jgi:carbohydrate diacid regulator
LRVFFSANCSSVIAARQLSIHRNTLSYRLDKIATLTGLDPRRFNDAVQLRISLELAAETA